MDAQELAERNKILIVRGGSHLYGTNVPESDEDFIGVFIPDQEYLIGLNRIEQVDESVKSKDEFGKNTSEATDKVMYTLDKFVRLALDNNPNILELLFVNEENIIFANDIGEELLSYRYEFISRNIKHRFLGYAFSQKHKMVIKLENYEHIEEAIEYLKDHQEIEFINEITHHPIFKRKKQVMTIGDTNLQANITRKKAIQSLERRAKKFGSRRQLVSKHGYDTKFAMHLIRLLFEGKQLLFRRDLQFPLKGRDLLLNIRNGGLTMDEVLTLASKIEEEVEALYEAGNVPDRPNFKVINKFVIDTHKKIICGGGM